MFGRATIRLGIGPHSSFLLCQGSRDITAGYGKLYDLQKSTSLTIFQNFTKQLTKKIADYM